MGEIRRPIANCKTPAVCNFQGPFPLTPAPPQFSLDKAASIISKHHFLDVALVMIRTIQRLRSPWCFSVPSHAHWVALHPALYFLQHLRDRTLTPQQIQQSLFKSVIADRPINLRRIFARRVPRAQLLLRLLAEQALQVGNKHCNLRITISAGVSL